MVRRNSQRVGLLAIALDHDASPFSLTVDNGLVPNFLAPSINLSRQRGAILASEQRQTCVKAGCAAGFCEEHLILSEEVDEGAVDL